MHCSTQYWLFFSGLQTFVKMLSNAGSAFKKLSMSLPESLWLEVGQLVERLGKVENAEEVEDPETQKQQQELSPQYCRITRQKEQCYNEKNLTFALRRKKKINQEQIFFKTFFNWNSPALSKQCAFFSFIHHNTSMSVRHQQKDLWESEKVWKAQRINGQLSWRKLSVLSCKQLLFVS